MQGCAVIRAVGGCGAGQGDDIQHLGHIALAGCSQQLLVGC
jgi:hypothetical protein